MIGFQKEKEFYLQIQDNLFEMVPEDWKKIFLHTEIIDIPNQKPQGKMYIYYIPKGILKRKPVNCYEVPNLFDIDEEEYSRLITNLYNVIKLLRDSYYQSKNKNWTTIDIICKTDRFIVEYGFEDLLNDVFSPEERHIIWRYKNLNVDLDSLSKNERKVLEYYIEQSKLNNPPEIEVHSESIYERPAKATVDYESTLTLDEIIARDKEAKRLEEKAQRKLAKQRKRYSNLSSDDEENIISNQILK